MISSPLTAWHSARILFRCEQGPLCKCPKECNCAEVDQGTRRLSCPVHESYPLIVYDCDARFHWDGRGQWGYEI